MADIRTLTVEGTTYNIKDATARADITNLKSAFNVLDVRTFPINQWNETWEVGGINGSTGNNGTTTNQIRSVGYIPVKPNTKYFFKMGNITGGGTIFCYGSDKTYLGLSEMISNQSGNEFTTGANTYYIRFSTGSAYGTTYNNDISINYPSTYTGYYPYTKSRVQYDFDNYAPLEHISAGTILRGKLANTYMNTSLNIYSGDVDSKLVPDVFYSVAGNAHNPNSTDNFTFVVLYAPWKNNARQTITQIATAIGGSGNIYCRTYQSYNTTWSEWTGVNPKSVLSDKKIVFLGDSTYAIAGNDGSKIPGWVKSMTAADTYNCAFGGTRISDSRTESSDYQYFDFPNLVDAIVAGDFTDQENHIPSADASSYTPALTRLKGIDFSEIDIVCVEYGTNDFTADVPLGTEGSTKETVYGGLVYGLNKLLTKYPNLIIFVDGIRYRAWLSSGSFVDDAYTHKNTLNLTMEDYADAIEKASYSMGLAYSDNLHGYGWNKYNRGTYFPANDNTHFNSTGAKYAAKIIVDKLIRLGGIY